MGPTVGLYSCAQHDTTPETGATGSHHNSAPLRSLLYSRRGQKAMQTVLADRGGSTSPWSHI